MTWTMPWFGVAEAVERDAELAAVGLQLARPAPPPSCRGSAGRAAWSGSSGPRSPRSASGWRTLEAARRSPVKACGLVTSWTRWRSTARTAGAPGSSATTWSSQIFSTSVRGLAVAIGGRCPVRRLPGSKGSSAWRDARPAPLGSGPGPTRYFRVTVGVGHRSVEQAQSVTSALRPSPDGVRDARRGPRRPRGAPQPSRRRTRDRRSDRRGPRLRGGSGAAPHRPVQRPAGGPRGAHVCRLPARPAPVEPPVVVPWYFMAAAFFAAELKVVDVHFRREKHSFSLSEFPAVIGFFLLTPSRLLPGDAARDRRPRSRHPRPGASQAAFNLVQLRCSPRRPPCSIFYLLQPPDGVPDPADWPAASLRRRPRPPERADDRHA